MGTLKLPVCAACGDEIAELASKCTVRGVPGHFHAGCAAQGRIIRNLYRAGLREAEWLTRKHAAGCDNSGERVVCKLIEHDIRARITALEEEGRL